MSGKKPRIGIIGTGYVGLVTGSCFADLGFDVKCLDVVPKKVEMINNANPPIYERGLDELLDRVVNERELLQASLDREEVFNHADLLFICLPTPSGEDGSIDLKFIKDEVAELGKLFKETDDYKVIVVKSTVVPGTTSGVVKELLQSQSTKTVGEDFGLAMNPEFLMEGVAISNFTDPDRVVIGAIDDRSYNMVKELYHSFDCPILRTSLSAAEMIKYASNSFLATKISFINEIANISEAVGIDVDDVAKGMGLDNRISSRFLRAGVGFGGSCFPKDVKALLSLSKQLGRSSNILEATIKTNEQQPLRVVKLLENEIDELKGKTIALLGLAFKPETDDMREAPSRIIAKSLLNKGAKVKGYDPIAKETAKEVLPDITHVDSVEELVDNADAAILVTEWNEFKSLTPSDLDNMKNKIIIDGRKVLDWHLFKDSGFKIKVIGQAYP